MSTTRHHFLSLSAVRNVSDFYIFFPQYNSFPSDFEIDFDESVPMKRVHTGRYLVIPLHCMGRKWLYIAGTHPGQQQHIIIPFLLCPSVFIGKYAAEKRARVAVCTAPDRHWLARICSSFIKSLLSVCVCVLCVCVWRHPSYIETVITSAYRPAYLSKVNESRAQREGGVVVACLCQKGCCSAAGL